MAQPSSSSSSSFETTGNGLSSGTPNILSLAIDKLAYVTTRNQLLALSVVNPVVSFERVDDGMDEDSSGKSSSSSSSSSSSLSSKSAKKSKKKKVIAVSNKSTGTGSLKQKDVNEASSSPSSIANVNGVPVTDKKGSTSSTSTTTSSSSSNSILQTYKQLNKDTSGIRTSKVTATLKKDLISNVCSFEPSVTSRLLPLGSINKQEYEYAIKKIRVDITCSVQKLYKNSTDGLIVIGVFPNDTKTQILQNLDSTSTCFNEYDSKPNKELFQEIYRLFKPYNGRLLYCKRLTLKGIELQHSTVLSSSRDTLYRYGRKGRLVPLRSLKWREDEGIYLYTKVCNPQSDTEDSSDCFQTAVLMSYYNWTNASKDLLEEYEEGDSSSKKKRSNSTTMEQDGEEGSSNQNGDSEDTTDSDRDNDSSDDSDYDENSSQDDDQQGDGDESSNSNSSTTNNNSNNNNNSSS